jgi:HlyD family secretion protein
MKNPTIAALLIAVLAAAAIFFYRDAFAKDDPQYRFATVEQGDMQSKVSSTGTLNAVTTVSVGTQVSGQVAQLLVDYNDHVKKGQLLARIDPTLAQQAVADAQANVDKARAQLLESTREHSRNRELLGAGLVARSAYDQSQSIQSVAQADVRSAGIALQRARQNLAYTSIFAPIDGVVVERNVQEGQTVAASLSAPQLFLIANDLAHMQILAQVGESDIAQIRQGQAVKFAVQALPNEAFKGIVQQVRLQSTTTDNVVNYTVVVAVDNPQGKLLPGMTARADFLTKSAANVLEVSNAALRFRPSQTAAVAKKTRPTTTTTATDTTSSTASARMGGRRNGTGQRPANVATLYTLDEKGMLNPIRVRTGINDGTFTQIEGKSLTAGMKVVAGEASASTQTASQNSGSSSPFGNSGNSGSRPQGGGRPGGF